MVGGEWVHDAGENDLVRIRRSSVGFVFQQFFLIPTLSVLENVTLPALFSKRRSNGRARELLELVAAGLTPYEALRTSTTTPFEYLGESDRAGTVDVGKESDLVLVGANPLEDIANASKIEGVLMQGRWIGKEEIRKRMEEIAGSFE